MSDPTLYSHGTTPELRYTLGQEPGTLFRILGPIYEVRETLPGDTSCDKCAFYDKPALCHAAPACIGYGFNSHYVEVR